VPEPHPWNANPLPPREAVTYQLTVIGATATGKSMKALLELAAQLEKLGHAFVKFERIDPSTTP
jgi:hypothetical protein